MRKTDGMSRQQRAAERRLRSPNVAQLGRLAHRVDGVIGEINYYLSAMAIGLVVLNLTALLPLAPSLQIRRVTYSQNPAAGCAAATEASTRPLDAQMHLSGL